MCCRRLLVPSVVAVAVLVLLAAGCGGGGSPQVAGGGTRTSSNGRVAAALALARCMRSHGIAGWPDPDSNGGFDKAKLRQLGVGVSRMRALEDGPCHITIPSAAPSTPITAADRADYLRAAACMRSHGFPSFPDPTFKNNTVEVHTPAGIDQDALAFKRAAEACTRLIPAGLPYAARRGS